MQVAEIKAVTNTTEVVVKLKFSLTDTFSKKQKSLLEFVQTDA